MKKNNNIDLEKIEQTIGVTFRDKDLLHRAFTHRSYLNENQDIDRHNERLEYLGDAVLEFLVSKFLFNKYPDRAEGELTSFRSATVKTDTLAETARGLEFGEHLRMSRGEEKTGGRQKDYLLANTFEAVIGAIYLDQGIRPVESFLKRELFGQIDTIVKNRLDIDPKTRFQELAQDHQRVTPSYELLSEKGPDHEKTFTMAVYLGEEEYGRGTGQSKQRAEEQAAKEALKKIHAEISKNRRLGPEDGDPA
jgi:ribonuclease III